MMLGSKYTARLEMEIERDRRQHEAEIERLRTRHQREVGELKEEIKALREREQKMLDTFTRLVVAVDQAAPALELQDAAPEAPGEKELAQKEVELMRELYESEVGKYPPEIVKMLEGERE